MPLAPHPGPDGSVQMQQGRQLLHQYTNPDLPLGMFPQAVEPITQTQKFQQSLDPYQETMLWPGHSPSHPAQPVPPPLDPYQETLLWPGHTLGSLPTSMSPPEPTQPTLLWPGITPQPYPSVPHYPLVPSASNLDRDIGGIQILTDSQMQRQSEMSLFFALGIDGSNVEEVGLPLLHSGSMLTPRKQWRKLSNKATHASRAACSAAAGGLWHAARLASLFEHDGSCVWCQDQAGTLHHVLYDCPAWDKARREAGLTFHPEFPSCLSYHGLVPAPPEHSLGGRQWTCPQRFSLSNLLLGCCGQRSCSSSVYRADLLALVTALQGSEANTLVVSDCESACRVVDQLWAGKRKPRGVHRDLEQRLLSCPRLGREVKWIKAHTDSKIAAVHGVSEADRLGNDRADKAAN
eukprot:3275700-Amphidinium_carterae.1